MSDPRLLDEDGFRAVAAMLEERCGLAFHAGNRDILDAGLLRVAEAERLSLASLAHLLVYPSDELLQRVIQAVTICETYFFRHPEQFTVLSEQVIPLLLRSGKKRLRALSAGCATGEEAYSLAMTLTTYVPGCDVQVLGTDINQAAQKIAERGRYGHHSLRVQSLLLDAFLVPTPTGEFEVAPLVKRLVSFRSANLRDANFASQLGQNPFGTSEGFDIIFCRNVLVYFAPALIAQVLTRLRDCLCEGGYLFVSALDYAVQIPGLEQISLDGVPLLRRVAPAARLQPVSLPPSRFTPAPSRFTPAPSRGTPSPSRLTPAPSRLTPSAILPRGTVIEPSAIRSALGAARAAADIGHLDFADSIARDALAQGRTAEALHLLALIVGERGDKMEMEALLLEAVDNHPDYVLGHLSLGLLDRPPPERWRSAQHLNTVLELLRARGDDEILHGPERVQVAMARRLARAGLENLERRP